jgi:hypothetical protein
MTNARALTHSFYMDVLSSEQELNHAIWVCLDCAYIPQAMQITCFSQLCLIVRTYGVHSTTCINKLRSSKMSTKQKISYKLSQLYAGMDSLGFSDIYITKLF